MNQHSLEPTREEAGAASTGVATPWHHWLANVLWHRRSIRAQLLFTFILIELIAVAVAGGVTIIRARAQTKVEIAASVRLAELFVNDTLELLREDAAPERVLANLPAQLRFLRHVRIVVKGTSDSVIPPPTRVDYATGLGNRATAPDWFASLIAPPVESHAMPVIINGRWLGSVQIMGEPADEIAEIWDNTIAFGVLAGIVNVVLIGMLYVILGRVLAPLTRLAQGLVELERRNYHVWLPKGGPNEFAVITDRFNALARALEAARAENTRLSGRLVSSQDDERRKTARELHDEVGPCLFGLKAQATSIRTLLDDCPDSVRASVGPRVGDMIDIIARLQAVNRSVLNRLRPMALGHVPLRNLLADLVQDRARQHPAITFHFSCAELARTYGDSIDLTIYRCLQESLTNAIRHGKPRTVDIRVDEAADAPDTGPAAAIELRIRDDGLGIAPEPPAGYGLNGMRERVEALGGRFSIDGETAQGSCVRIVLPLRAGPATTDESEGTGAAS